MKLEEKAKGKKKLVSLKGVKAWIDSHWVNTVTREDSEYDGVLQDLIDDII